MRALRCLLGHGGGDTVGEPADVVTTGVRSMQRQVRDIRRETRGPRLLQNQRGSVVAHAVRREMDAVICRLRFRLF
ncbi:hypothetical protein [Streptomyces violaceus]|uniref:Uncharacterized protein n=1 Tax=Streptomyces violaceus TaxID=1936 RepID=A0ABY9UIV3_STRVL|nr:hypothetical protein [Streptomyces janthinus]WND22779.1 hypothetical protein RI060_37915 [Streptomyces janthinus]